MKVLVCLLCMSGVAFAERHIEHAVHVPEPMIFDLVRGLGAQRGEFEINVLGQFPLNDRSARGIEWAPEVEFAVADGVGIEVELPFNDGHLEAYKLAGQVTFSGLYRRPFLHGVQAIFEKIKGEDIVELSALYVPVLRFNDTFSGLAMIGVRTEVGGGSGGESALLNATFFAEPSRASAVGLELNFAATRHDATLVVMPQIEHELDEHWTIQAGVGAKLGEDRVEWTGALRLVWGTHPGPAHPLASQHAARRR